MGHGAWGMGNGEWEKEKTITTFPMPNAQCPMPHLVIEWKMLSLNK
ncbi:hypothetical protein [Tolypothrix sp. VBCCA 56010]